MNWLLYIGGGCMFVLIGMIFLGIFCNYEAFRSEVTDGPAEAVMKNIFFFGIIVALISIWVWICLNYIK